MEQSMTSGNITKQVFSFSVPLILGNLFQQMYNTADAVIVSKMIGNNAFAAVSVANPIMSVVLFFMVGLSLGVGVLLAQRYGARDIEGFKIQYSTALIAGGVFAVAVSVICTVCSKWMLQAVHTPQEIFADTERYLRIVFIGLVFSFLYNYLASALRSIGDSRTAFLFLVLSSLMNVVLDVLFIRYTHLGVSGAALATVIAQAMSCGLCVLYIYCKIPLLALQKQEFMFEPGVLKKTIVFSWAAALQQTFLYLGRLLVQGTINARGTDMITGYNAAVRLEAFQFAFIDGTANAVATFAGQNVGAGRTDRLKKGLVRTIQMNLGFMFLWNVVMLWIPETVIGLYVDPGNETALKIGMTYITVMPVFYAFSGTMSAMQGFFRGVGRVKVTMIATFSQIITRCILAMLLVPRYGIYGVCISVISGWVLMLFYNGLHCLHFFKEIKISNDLDR